MNRFGSLPLLLLVAGTAPAAEPSPVPEVPKYIQVFRGQWTFLNTSTAFCMDQVPAMKREFERAREHAQAQMERAESIVLRETGNNERGYKPVFDTYSGNWMKYAGELLAALKKQNAGKACPDLLGNWNAIDADIVLEDWRGFLERSDPVKPAEPAGEVIHGA